jgi:hypothetical protein
MRVIKESKEFHLPTNAKQRLLLMCWYSLTHQKSLDSHRVRCMNSLSILVELERLISKSLHKIDQDIARSADEALSILQSDYVVMDQYARHFHRLQPILAGLRAGPSQKDVFGRSKKLGSFYLKDAISDLRKDYRSHLFARIWKALEDMTDETPDTELADLIASLLSVLIEEGRSIEELFSLLRDLFLRRTPSVNYTFQQSFNLARRILESPPAEHEVVFKLIGWGDRKRIPENVGKVRWEGFILRGIRSAVEHEQVVASAARGDNKVPLSRAGNLICLSHAGRRRPEVGGYEG